MAIFMQPGEGQSTLDAISAASADAVSGTGLFAWASREGVRRLLDLVNVQQLLAEGDLRLIIGLDAVTNLAALDALEASTAAHPNLHVELFLHDEARIFHPKTIWFRRSDRSGELVTGSGNLTAWGLTGNWEFGARVPLDTNDLSAIDRQFYEWHERYAGHLVAITDERGRERAARNRTPERSAVRREARIEADYEDAAGVSGHPAVESGRWFLADLPRGRGGYVQTGFPYVITTEFFNYQAESPFIDLQEVDDDGNSGSTEHRLIGAKQSVNWAFDLDGARGIALSDPGPIGAFLRLADGTFRYHIVLPTSTDYEKVSDLLDQLPGQGPHTNLRKAYPSIEDIRHSWPTCPLLLISVVTTGQ